MFLAILRYKVSREALEPFISSHGAFLEEAYGENNLTVSGPMLSGRGEVIFSPLTRLGEFHDVLRKDPFMVHDLASYETIAFDPSHFHQDFASFVREIEREKIELVPYTPEWKSQFEEEAKALSAALSDTRVAIHHIGSTAIPGIVAKPIVDILPVVKDIHVIDQLTPSLEALGYEAKGEYGMPGRRFFVKKQSGKQRFNMHIFQEGHADIERHLRFRDYLLTHPEDANTYSELKKSLITLAADDIERYCWGKNDFIKATEVRAMLWRTLPS
jgi:GrpB-like predicted nucleotidyltransferase (UPF0157 family)/uncharacterized protein YciI